MTQTDDPNSLRVIFRVNDDGSESRVRMQELAKGDRFRIKAQNPDDYLYRQEMKVFEAQSDAYLADGVWAVQVEL